MISLTALAVEKLEKLLPGKLMLRVLVKTTGCSGLAYHLEYSLYKNVNDIKEMVKGIPVVIDPKSLVYVDGCEIDYKYEGLNEGFEFYNPREKARCGCGESFTV